MSNTLRHRALRYIHKFPWSVSYQDIIEQSPPELKDLVKKLLTEHVPDRGLPIRTGERSHRHGNNRKYYAEMKLRGRRRLRAMGKQEFIKSSKLSLST